MRVEHTLSHCLTRYPRRADVPSMPGANWSTAAPPWVAAYRGLVTYTRHNTFPIRVRRLQGRLRRVRTYRMRHYTPVTRLLTRHGFSPHLRKTPPPGTTPARYPT